MNKPATELVKELLTRNKTGRDLAFSDLFDRNPASRRPHYPKGEGRQARRNPGPTKIPAGPGDPPGTRLAAGNPLSQGRSTSITSIQNG